MKKVALMISALGVLSSACFGQELFLAQQKGRTPHPAFPRKAAVPLEVKGRVDSVILAEPTKGIRPKIALICEDGKHCTFLVGTTTTIYGPGWKAITLGKMAKDRMVRVQYITSKEGFLIALSVKPV